MVQVPGVFTSFLEEQRGSGTYYDAGFNYRFGYPSVWAQLTLLGHYLMETFQGKALSSPLGTGIDVSAVFLAKGGVSGWTLAVFNAAMATLGIVGGWLMLRDRTKALSENN